MTTTAAEYNANRIARLAYQYSGAREIYENSQLGPRTDAAWLRMERIMERVEKLGPEAVAAFGKEIGY